jgi:hypothetical protein
VTKTQSKDFISALSGIWGQALQDKRYHDALLVGLCGYLFCHDRNDKALETVALSWIRKASEPIQQQARDTREQGRKKQNICSFCSRGEPEVKLAAGPAAFICDSCVKMLSKVFKSQKSDKVVVKR